MALQALNKAGRNEKCVFCHRSEINELLYGKMYKFQDIITHYFCMLFSSNMEQNGTDEQGILGFLPTDVRKEVTRGKKLPCSYCHRPGATIGCSKKSCRKKFHYPCGIQNNSRHLFYTDFKSFCYAHEPIPTRKPPPSAIDLTSKKICVMCQDEVMAKSTPATVWSACCQTTWLHRDCVQKMALNAGYFFKCPACNNRDIFRSHMLECGIYIPDQDAAWELEDNAYYELTERYNSCDAANCVCPQGRNFSEAGPDFEITLCNFCGSQGIHIKCGENLFDRMGHWTCTSCSSVTKTSTPATSTSIEEPGPSTISQKRNNPPRQSQNLRKERSHKMSSRKRSLSSDSENESNSLKIVALESQPLATNSNETIRLLDSSGEQIEVVRLENISASGVEIGGVKVAHPENNTQVPDIVQIDSDDEDECSPDSTTQSRTTPADKNTTNNKVIPDTAPSIIIDLLDDSDEEETLQGVAEPVNDDDDDVIFVSHDEPTPAKEDNSTAIIRIVDNDRVYVTTPMDIRRGSNMEMFRNTNANTVTTNFRPLRNFVWQSVPLRKTNANFAQLQITSAISLGNPALSNNNNAGSNYIAKENESNWTSSEIINID